VPRGNAWRHYRIGRIVNSTLDADAILDRLTDEAMRATRATHGSALVPHPTLGRIERRSLRGYSPELVERARAMSLSVDQGLHGRAYRTQQVVNVEDVRTDPDYFELIPDTRAELVAPIISGGQVVGSLDLQSPEASAFRDVDLGFLQALTDQVAIALANARLFEETRRRLDEMAVVSYVAMVGAAGQPFDETVARATSSLNQLWPGATVGFLFVDEADQTLRPHPSYFGVPPEAIANLRVPLNQGLTGWAMRVRQPIRVGDVTSDPHYIAGVPGTRSEMAAPLVVGERVIGVVNVERPRPDVFSGEDLRLLATLASQLATIFEKARLDAELALHAAMLERRVEERTTEIRRQQARTQAILDALGEGVVVTDSRGTIQYLNPAAQALTGYGADEVIGQNPRLWNSGRVPLQVYQEMWNTILAGRTWRGEIVNRRKDGALYDVAITIAPVLGETSGGPPASLVGIQRDITLHKQAEEEIRKALAQEKELSELKSRFISMASHEFRTPLSTILSSSELLEHYGSQWLEGKGLVNLRRIQAAVHHMAQLLNDVLVLGRADAGKLEFNPAPMDLVQFCRELTEEIQLGVGRQHTFLFASQGECVGACLDEKLLRQILSNLLSNACKYSPEGSDVHFDLECREGQVIFCVRDQGIGIPPEDQARLFETFHRARNVNNIPGTGLGMAIVKKSVDLHGEGWTSQDSPRLHRSAEGKKAGSVN
jgi:PAS domain S-box-containing protein